MREYRFRAWNKEKKVMCYDNEDDTAEYWDGAISSDVGMVNYIINRDFDHIFMQWTGLKGKDNKYIYEHDIVLFEGKPFVVWYVNRVGCFRLRPIFMFTFGGQRQHDGALSFSKKFRDCYCYEVIDNIYENPELLEQP